MTKRRMRPGALKSCGDSCKGCACVCHSDGKPKPNAAQLVAEAEKQLKTWPCVKVIPDWHPYYWIGQREAAKRLK